jgi:hypothetical protein
MFEVLVDISLKVLLQKRDTWLCKNLKKKEKREEKMNTKVSKILKTMGT